VRHGARVELTSELPAEYVLFGEDASRVVISCDPANVGKIQQVAVKYGVAADRIGGTTQPQFEVVLNGEPVVSAAVSELEGAWAHALERALHVDTEERLVPQVLQKS